MKSIITLHIILACVGIYSSSYAQSNQPAYTNIFDQPVAIDPYDGDSWHLRGLTQLALHYDSVALDYYNNAIQANPFDKEAYFKRGVIEMRLKKYAQAEQDFTTDIKQNHASYKGYFNRAFAKFKLDDWDGALKDCNEAIVIKPCDTTYRSLGVLRVWMKQYDLAVKAFDKAIELNPAYTDAYVRRARVQGQLTNYDAAFKDFDKAIELNPNYAEAYIERANLKEDKSDYESAIADCNKAIELDANNPQAFVNRGWEKNRLGQKDSALADFNHAIKLAPKFALAYSCRCAVKDEMDNLNGALTDCNKAIRLDSTLHYAYNNRSIVRRKMGQVLNKEANEDYSKSLELLRGKTPDYTDAETTVNKPLATVKPNTQHKTKHSNKQCYAVEYSITNANDNINTSNVAATTEYWMYDDKGRLIRDSTKYPYPYSPAAVTCFTYKGDSIILYSDTTNNPSAANDTSVIMLTEKGKPIYEHFQYGTKYQVQYRADDKLEKMELIQMVVGKNGQLDSNVTKSDSIIYINDDIVAYRVTKWLTTDRSETFTVKCSYYDQAISSTEFYPVGKLTGLSNNPMTEFGWLNVSLFSKHLIKKMDTANNSLQFDFQFDPDGLVTGFTRTFEYKNMQEPTKTKDQSTIRYLCK